LIDPCDECKRRDDVIFLATKHLRDALEVIEAYEERLMPLKTTDPRSEERGREK
jgi:hypothetical protein